jgi:hypothetical protein
MSSPIIIGSLCVFLVSPWRGSDANGFMGNQQLTVSRGWPIPLESGRTAYSAALAEPKPSAAADIVSILVISCASSSSDMDGLSFATAVHRSRSRAKTSFCCRLMALWLARSHAAALSNRSACRDIDPSTPVLEGIRLRTFRNVGSAADSSGNNVWICPPGAGFKSTTPRASTATKLQ